MHNVSIWMLVVVFFPYSLVVGGGLFVLRKMMKGELKPAHDVDLGTVVNTGRMRFRKIFLGVREEPKPSRFERSMTEHEEEVSIGIQEVSTEAITEKMPLPKFQERTLRYVVTNPRRRRIYLSVPARVKVPILMEM